MFRLPTTVLDVETAHPYCVGDAASVWAHGRHTILAYSDEQQDDYWEEASENWLASITPLRADLAAGDLRLLYLGWLLGPQNGHLEDDELEPPVPARLGDLSASLQRFAQFLRIDSDLIDAAAQASPPPDEEVDPAALTSWISDLTATDKDDLILQMIRGEDPHLGTALMRRFRTEAGSANAAHPQTFEPRTVGELLYEAATLTMERDRLAAQRRAEEQERQARAAAAATRQRLAALAAEGDAVWRRVERLVGSRKPGEYDAAVAILTDLRALAREDAGSAAFDERLSRLRADHARKPSLITRLERAGLGQTPDR